MDHYKEIFIIRHGQTLWNIEQRMQGRLDSPLSDEGKLQAQRHAEVLAANGGVDHFIVSPSGRTRETASIVNARIQAPIDFEEVLMERDCGEWSGFTVQEIEREFPQEWAARDEAPFYHRPPGGENVQDLVERVQPLLDEIDKIEGGRIGLITHGVMSRAILTSLLELTPVEAMRVRHPNDLFYRLRYSGGQLWPQFWRDGVGPVSGLLRTTPDETILRSKN